jgi:hypothetical protein
MYTQNSGEGQPTGERIFQPSGWRRPLGLSTVRAYFSREGEQAFRPFNRIENSPIERVEQAFRPFNRIENSPIERVEQAFRPFDPSKISQSRGWSRPSGLR